MPQIAIFGPFFATMLLTMVVLHCTANVVTVCFHLYLMSMLAVFFMLGRAAIAHFSS